MQNEDWLGDIQPHGMAVSQAFMGLREHGHGARHC